MITIRFGVNTLNREDLSGSTVRDIRDMVGEALSVPSNASVRVNNCTANDDTVVCDGSTVEFIKPAGEKGAQSTVHDLTLSIRLAA